MKKIKKLENDTISKQLTLEQVRGARSASLSRLVGGGHQGVEGRNCFWPFLSSVGTVFSRRALVSSHHRAPVPFLSHSLATFDVSGAVRVSSRFALGNPFLPTGMALGEGCLNLRVFSLSVLCMAGLQGPKAAFKGCSGETGIFPQWSHRNRSPQPALRRWITGR